MLINSNTLSDSTTRTLVRKLKTKYGEKKKKAAIIPKILVVEDSTVVQNMVKQVLEFQEYRVDTAKNGKEALKLYSGAHYDLVLMDINMPVMDGVECLKRIRAMADKKKASIPVIAITGNAEEYSEHEFLQAGFSAVYQKPVDFDRLSKLIQEYMHKSE